MCRERGTHEIIEQLGMCRERGNYVELGKKRETKRSENKGRRDEREVERGNG